MVIRMARLLIVFAACLLLPLPVRAEQVLVRFQTIPLPHYDHRGRVTANGIYGGGWALPDLSGYRVLRLLHDQGALFALIDIESGSPDAILSDSKVFAARVTNRVRIAGKSSRLIPDQTVMLDMHSFQPEILTGDAATALLKQWGLLQEPPAESGVTTAESGVKK